MISWRCAYIILTLAISLQAEIELDGSGDFYTSPCLTPVFGALIGKQLEEMWVALGRTAFTIVEYGAGDGRLCHDILNYLQQNEELYEAVKLYNY